jgi:CubicO group peptidase (beta-lactamase class C family)
MAEGILGQFIYVNPTKNMVIVRMGKDYGRLNWESLFKTISKYPEK